jgi:hypothetical protein
MQFPLDGLPEETTLTILPLTLDCQEKREERDHGTKREDIERLQWTNQLVTGRLTEAIPLPDN